MPRAFLEWVTAAAMGLALLGCTQIDGSPPCYSPEILHYCEGLCTARTCGEFSFEERIVPLFICAKPNDYIKLRHRFLVQAMKRGYGIGDCNDPVCRASIDGDGPIQPPPPYHEQGESEAAGAWAAGTGLPPEGGDCVP